MLVAVRPRFSVTYFQFRENGKVVGEMERSLWRETAELDLDDERYSFFRDQVIGGNYVIERKGQILARATKPKWWRSNLDVELFKRSAKLRRPSILTRRFGVFERGRRVGTISRQAMLANRRKLDRQREGTRGLGWVARLWTGVRWRRPRKSRSPRLCNLDHPIWLPPPHQRAKPKKKSAVEQSPIWWKVDL